MEKIKKQTRIAQAQCSTSSYVPDIKHTRIITGYSSQQTQYCKVIPLRDIIVLSGTLNAEELQQAKSSSLPWPEEPPRDTRTEKLFQLLENLKDAEYTPRSEYLKTVCLVEDVLVCFFRIETSKNKLSQTTDKDKQQKIGELIAEALDAIGSWVSHSLCQIHEGTIENYKIERSGLEFMLQRYKKISDGSDSLEEAFTDFKDIEGLEGWDKHFRNIYNCYDPNFYYKTSDEPTLSKQELEEVRDHWWWW